MKKEYVSPVVNSLRYMFQDAIATGTTEDDYDVLFPASQLFPTPTNG